MSSKIEKLDYITKFLSGFDDEIIYDYLEQNRSDLVRSIEQKGYDEGEQDGIQKGEQGAYENADPIDILGEPMRNEGYD